MPDPIARVFVLSAAAAIASAGSAGSGLAADTIYSFTDERGVLWLSNVPVDPRYRPVLTYAPTQGTRDAVSTLAAPSSTASSENDDSGAQETASAGAFGELVAERYQPSDR